jgi:hypothetical protein
MKVHIKKKFVIGSVKEKKNKKIITIMSKK